LVASRLTERFQRPSLVFAHDEAASEATGSARSIAGVDIGAAVRAAVEGGLARKGGGHAMAAGVTVPIAGLAAFGDFMRTRLAGAYGQASAAPLLPVDGLLTPEGATADLAKLVERAGPFGQDNPAPRFVLPSVKVGFVKVLPGGHIRCSLLGQGGSQLSAVAFRAEGSPCGDGLLKTAGKSLHVAGRLQCDEWGGRERVELLIEDLAGVEFGG
jgi:single-stranded-DNA-specific exonuclease